MKTAVLILAVLDFPLVVAVTVAAMVSAKRGSAVGPQGVTEFAVVGAVLAVVSAAIPLAILLRAF
ncbi:MAG: hypothetical protein WBC44_01090 [Planctomycetaceae bacterium]